MKRKSIFFIAAILFFAVSESFSLSQTENDYIEKILSFRLSLRTCASADEAIEKIHEFESAEKGAMRALGEEARLVAENMLRTAEYNCEYEKDVKSPALEPILRPAFTKITSYNAAHSEESLSAIYIISSADVINSMMQFLPQSEAIRLGMQEKKSYAAVLEKNPAMTLALIDSAFWYYFAPAVVGGSKKKAQVFFEDALKYASNDYEKFYAAIYLSQFHFEQKDEKSAKLYLSQAEKVLPGTRYIKFIEKINSLGFSLYDFNNNSSREKVNKKLAAQKNS